MLGRKEGRIDKGNIKYLLIIAVFVIGLIIIFFIFKQNTSKDDSSIDKSNNKNSVLYSNTQNGVTLEIENLTFVKTKEDYGLLTDMTISITNNGVSDINPTLYILVYDDAFNVQYRTEKRVKISTIINASVGKISHLKVPIDLGVGGIKNDKLVKLILYNGAGVYTDVNLVSIDFKINFLENIGSLNEGKIGIFQRLF